MTENKAQGPRLSEFVSLMALMMSLVALSIDAMLPALADIGRDLGTTDANQPQLVVSVLFLGLALGQIVYGPLSDAIGRKKPIYAGLAIYLIGSVLCVLAESFAVMLVGHFLQGLGVAGPRIVTMALVRDQFEGRAMARIMSLIMAVFIIVPALAPAVGQGILELAEWRAIFGLLLALATIAFLWFSLRQPETLAPSRRLPWSARRFATGLLEALRNPKAIGYTITAGLVFSGFIGYLTVAPQIFQTQYRLGAQFPLYFGGLALAIGAASLLNARMVMKFGMQLLSRRALQAQCVISALCFAYVWFAGGSLPLWALMVWGSAAFFCQGLLFGNLNAMAMEPLSHIAGIGAAVIGTLTSIISLTLGTVIGQAYNRTVLPLIGGFAGLGLAGLVVMAWTGEGVSERIEAAGFIAEQVNCAATGTSPLSKDLKGCQQGNPALPSSDGGLPDNDSARYSDYRLCILGNPNSSATARAGRSDAGAGHQCIG
jgi:DHA1 family bicyclomycin/chloramphenicol resistance-like MFS transporter